MNSYCTIIVMMINNIHLSRRGSLAPDYKDRFQYHSPLWKNTLCSQRSGEQGYLFGSSLTLEKHLSINEVEEI